MRSPSLYYLVNEYLPIFQYSSFTTITLFPIADAVLFLFLESYYFLLMPYYSYFPILIIQSWCRIISYFLLSLFCHHSVIITSSFAIHSFIAHCQNCHFTKAIKKRARSPYFILRRSIIMSSFLAAYAHIQHWMYLAYHRLLAGRTFAALLPILK